MAIRTRMGGLPLTVAEAIIIVLIGSLVIASAAYAIKVYLRYIRLVRILHKYEIRAYKRIRRPPI